MATIHEKITQYAGIYGIAALSNRTGVAVSVIKHLLRHRQGRKHRRETLDRLYRFFRLEEDEFYRENSKRWVRPTESVVGTIFLVKRHELGLSRSEVARRIKMDERQVARIELGDCLPSENGYAIRHLLEFYGFAEDERARIAEYIRCLRDVRSIGSQLLGHDDMEKTAPDGIPE